MGLQAALAAYVTGRGAWEELVAAVRDLPARPEATDPMGQDDPGPIPGESFDLVTAAWTADQLSDDEYQALIAAARH